MFQYLFRSQKLRFVLYCCAVLISSMLEVGLAYIMSVCVELAMRQELSGFAKYGALFAGYIVLDVCCDYLTKFLRAKLLEHAQLQLRDDSAKRLLALDPISFHEKNSGEWVSVLCNDVEMVGQSYFGTILFLFPDVLSFVISLLCVCFLSWPIALYVIVFTLIQMLIPKLLSPRISNAKKMQSQQAANFTTTATEHLQGFDLLQSFHLSAQSLVSLHHANTRWESAKFSVKYLNALAKTLSFGFSQLIYVGLYFFGAILVVLGNLPLATMIAITQLSVYIISPLQTFSADVSEIISSKEICKKLLALGEQQSQPHAYQQPPRSFESLRLQDVSFAYDQSNLFSDVSFSFEKGKKYILCGPSGSGKTTLAKLLSGSLRPTNGRILLNDISIEELAPSDYVNFVSVCSQNIFLFDDTLRNNVTLYSSRCDDAQIVKVLDAVGFLQVLQRFKLGLDERIGQSGLNLSGGEKQRIALARMLLFDTPFLILDESFANLDSESSLDLLKRMTAREDKTILYIGHHIPGDVARLFDEVLQIEGGCLRHVPNEPL